MNLLPLFSLLGGFLAGLGTLLSPLLGQGLDPSPEKPQKKLVEKARKNILMIIADDLGVDCLGCYGEHPEPGHMPVVDGLAARGTLFRNAWSYPTCSPSRAALLTGRHAFRTGIGYVIHYESSQLELCLDEVTLPSVLGQEYRTAVVGKWHLSTQTGSGLRHPMRMGFDHHRGSMDNLSDAAGEQAYFSYDKSVDGVLTHSEVYATTDAVNDALELIDSFGNDPWFLWLAFNAPHGPYHKPPPPLHTFDLPPNVMDDLPMHMRAMAEAMDTEIGRLLASMDPIVLANTVIIFLGDNGTAQAATTPPFLKDHAKGTVYEGGVNVPLIVAGPGVASGAQSDALVSVVDLFATVAEIAGAAFEAAEDSVSLVPCLEEPNQPSPRPWVYSEKFKPNGFDPYYSRFRVVRNRTYKLMHVYAAYSPQIEEIHFFDLLSDPFEMSDLMEGVLSPAEGAAYQTLTLLLEGIGR